MQSEGKHEARDVIQDWARDYVLSTSLAHKIAPPPLPREFATGLSAERLAAPGRPACLRVVERSKKTPKPGALVRPEARARLLHTFWHHELQAAELFAWAVLAFPESPEPFRRGLLGIMLEEIEHMALYQAQIERLGHAIGDFEVRDWFWMRVPRAQTPTAFLSFVGLGLEAVNLDHAASFAAALEAAGDFEAAGVQAQVGREEERHVAFAAHWFPQLSGQALSFEAWEAALPAPLSPLIFRGQKVNSEARLRAGFDADFLRELEAWKPAPRG